MKDAQAIAAAVALIALAVLISWRVVKSIRLSRIRRGPDPTLRPDGTIWCPTCQMRHSALNRRGR